MGKSKWPMDNAKSMSAREVLLGNGKAVTEVRTRRDWNPRIDLIRTIDGKPFETIEFIKAYYDGWRGVWVNVFHVTGWQQEVQS